MVFRAVIALSIVGSLALLSGCSDDMSIGSDASFPDGSPDATPDAGSDAMVAPGPQTLTHRFSPVPIESGEEISGLCQSWDMGNETELFVRSVRSRNDGAWHHSNWLWAPQSMFAGEGDTWRCRDRGWDEVVAGFAGDVFFAQSTQAIEEAQVFAPGTAIRIPPNSSVVGGVHLLNATPNAMNTAIEFEVDTVPESEVDTVLVGTSFTITNLAIPPRTESRFSMTCDIGEVYQRTYGKLPDFKIYYVLPHYHTLGTFFRLDLVGGSRDGDVIFEQESLIGEPLGETLAVPVDVTGSEQLRFTCGYDNPRNETVRFGIGDQEMCVFLAFTDAPARWVADSTSVEYVADVDGIPHYEAECRLLTVF
ncbi:MAG: hypothetical protein AAGF12_15195 [Myxococcota bacterium]